MNREILKWDSGEIKGVYPFTNKIINAHSDFY
jgi:hypothetical protein